MAEERSEQELHRPATLAQKLEMAARFSAVVAATVPTTTLPPMALTYLTYRRFRDEERFHRWHQMQDWAEFCIKRIMKADVRVEGRRRPRATARGASSFEFDRQVLEAAPTQEGADVLKRTPGLFIARGAGMATGHRYVLRGFDADHGQDTGKGEQGRVTP